MSSHTIENLLTHRSIRKFKNKKIAQDTFDSLILAGQAAASSSFLQGVTIIRITDKNKRNALCKISGNQKYIEEAPEFIVFCADLNRSMRCCVSTGGSPMEGLTEHFLIATVDTAIFAQNVVVAAESIGLGICYIGAIRNDPKQTCLLLDLPQHTYPLFGMCIGWPAQDPEIKPRLPIGVVARKLSQLMVIMKRSNRMMIRCGPIMRLGAKTKVRGLGGQMASLLAREARPIC